MEYQHIWRKVLAPNEQVKYEFTVGSRYCMIGAVCTVALGLLLAIASFQFGLIIAALGGFYFGFYLKAANVYAFTDKRVLIHKGWLSTQMISTDYQKVTDVMVIEPFLDRIVYHTGSIEIDSAGTNRENIVLKHVERPYEIKKKLDELRTH
jgi:hypothetical protein